MAKDIYHKVVKEALEKDGWIITHDPYLIPRNNKKPYEVDIGAEKFIAATKDNEKIAVEIKSFMGTSMTYDFHAAFGQYNVYRFFMHEKDHERLLYLAISEEAYNSFFTDSDIHLICSHFNIQLIIFDALKTEITQWIKR